MIMAILRRRPLIFKAMRPRPKLAMLQLTNTSGTEYLPSNVVLPTGEIIKFGYEKTIGNPNTVTGRLH